MYSKKVYSFLSSMHVIYVISCSHIMIKTYFDGGFGERGGVSTSFSQIKSSQAHNKEIQVITNLSYIKQTGITKTIIFFIPQQSEIHVCLTTRYKVTHPHNVRGPESTRGHGPPVDSGPLTL